MVATGRKQRRGARGPVRENKKGEMGWPNGIVEFFIYSKEFQILIRLKDGLPEF
jgi:hypothetical protein